MAKSTPIQVELGPESLAALREMTEALREHEKINEPKTGLKIPIDALPKYARGGYVSGGTDGILINEAGPDQVIPKSASKKTDTIKVLLHEGETVRSIYDLMLTINKKWLEKFNTLNCAVSEVTGYSTEQLDELGGFEEPEGDA